MMKYDFTTVLDRRGKDALALDVTDRGTGFSHDYFSQVKVRDGFDRIPMWVADMNFATAPSIQRAMTERIAHPVFGYFLPREEYFGEIIKWQESRNGVAGLTKECIGYENGVLGGVSSALAVLCSKGDNVLVHSPVYTGFVNTLSNNGYHMVLSPLKRDDRGIWRMDYEDMERQIVKNQIHTAILCNPHNPAGRVWERQELEKAMELYQRYNVYVISDEIWSDLTLAGYHHIPTQTISEDAKNRTVALYAPSKTFNLAGLVGSYHIIYNPWLRDRIRKESSLGHYNNMNMLSMYALIGAYQPEGYEWLEELRGVLTENADYAYNFICEHFKGVSLSKPQATYMLFLDCEEWCRAHGKTIDDLQRAGLEVGVMWQDGRAFRGPYSIRMNLAHPLSRVKEAFARLDKYVFNSSEGI